MAQKRAIVSAKGPQTVMQGGKPSVVMQEHVLIFDLDQPLKDVLNFISNKGTHVCTLIFETEVQEPRTGPELVGPN